MRSWLLCALSCAAMLWASTEPRAAETVYPQVTPGLALQFPRDHGSHPDFRLEWWYLTGWLQTADGQPLGFQVTFFRLRPTLASGNPSAFAPTQLLIAHAAISDPARGRLWSDQRIARAALNLAGAAEGDTNVWLDRWRLTREPSQYHARIEASDFALALTLETTQPMLLNGERGYSRKGPQPQSASYYYSLPQLRVAGSVTRDGRATTVSGLAWLDHEWSSEYLEPRAAGWDWVGLNLDDGSALMAFRIRDRDGRNFWAGGTWRDAAGRTEVLRPEAVQFMPGRRWRSLRTGIEYPVEWTLQAGSQRFELQPLLDDQESDSRATTGAVYWEGAVIANRDGRRLGRGYLELTGYGSPLRLP